MSRQNNRPLSGQRAYMLRLCRDGWHKPTAVMHQIAMVALVKRGLLEADGDQSRFRLTEAGRSELVAWEATHVGAY